MMNVFWAGVLIKVCFIYAWWLSTLYVHAVFWQWEKFNFLCCRNVS